MDEAKVEKTADAQLKHAAQAHRQVTTIDALAKEVAELQLGLGAPLFGFGSQQDFKDATQVIARRSTRAGSACPTATTT